MRTINRRLFLKQGALLAAIASPITLLGQRQKIAGLTDEQWRMAIDYARLCPSIHNLQAHRIKVLSDQNAALYYQSDALLPVGDPQAIFSTVALGVFIEHLSIAVAPYGKNIMVDKIVADVNNNTTGLIHFANLKIADINQDESLDRTLFLKRRTARKKYNGKKFANTSLKKIQHEAAYFEHKLNWSNDSDFIKFMIDINQKTLFEDLENEDMRAELDSLFRYNKKSARLKKDGLSAKCMGFPGKLMRSIFQNHEQWTKGIRKRFLRSRYKKSFKGTETIAWMTGNFETTKDFVEAGRAMARVWLRITAEGGYIQPFGSLITNKTAFEKMQTTLQIPEEDKKLWMIFRVGYSDTPAKSERLDLDTILLESHAPYYSLH